MNSGLQHGKRGIWSARVKAGTDFHTFLRSQSPESQEEFERCSEKRWAQAGQILCRQDEPSDAVYIIEQGVVEVIVESRDTKDAPPLAYLSRGDIIGELGILNERSRSATLRVATDVYYRWISSENFLTLVSTAPGFGLYLTYRLAERLANTTANLAYNSYCVDLSGKLPEFDLLTVCQTIRDSSCRGEMKIINTNKDLLGSFWFSEGNLDYGRFMHLQGEEAVWQVFLEDSIEGAFSFKRMEAPSLQQYQEHEVARKVTDVLLTAAMKRDHWQKLSPQLRSMDTMIARQGPVYYWPDEENAFAAGQIWSLLEREALSLGNIWQRCNCSRLTVGQVVRQFLASGQAVIL